MSTRPLPYISEANNNPLQMLVIMKLRVHLGHTRVTLKLIVCKILEASTTIDTEFCDQRMKAIPSKQRFVELDNGDCIPIIQKPQGRKESQPPLPDGLTYPKDNPPASPIVRVAGKPFFPHTSKNRYRSNRLGLPQQRYNHATHSMRKHRPKRLIKLYVLSQTFRSKSLLPT